MKESIAGPFTIREQPPRPPRVVFQGRFYRQMVLVSRRDCTRCYGTGVKIEQETVPEGVKVTVTYGCDCTTYTFTP